MSTKLRLVKAGSAAVKVPVPKAGRLTDAAYGRDTRKYLHPHEVESLIRAGRDLRHGRRDSLLLSLTYHHGLRASEAVGLTWADLDLRAGMIMIHRKKNGVGGPQHIEKGDLKELRTLRKKVDGQYVFVSERGGGPLDRNAFGKIVRKAGALAGLPPRLCYCHSLRHSFGHTVAHKVNSHQVQSLLGHKDARSTQIYVKGISALIKGLWDK
jgi:integrase